MSWTLASAYPSDALSAVQVAAMVLAAFSGVAIWLALVYLAARPARQRPRVAATARDRGSPDAGLPAPVTGSRPALDEAADHDEVGVAGHV